MWASIVGDILEQGDLLSGCLVPRLHPDFAPDNPSTRDAQVVKMEEFDLIIMTQSCDLGHGKVRQVATCPVYTLIEFETHYPEFKKKDKRETLLKQKIISLYPLPAPSKPEEREASLIVDFREIFSLSIALGSLEET